MLWYDRLKLKTLAAVQKLWYGDSLWRWLLWPMSWFFVGISILRRQYLEMTRPVFRVPIIVVGNLTVGGVGKTPLVIAIARHLSTEGLRVGIVSRGYGANIGHFPHEVATADSAAQVGDEPLLLAQKTACPVVIAPKRREAVQYLLDNHQSQVIISDDGLQHYAMSRSIEIVVVDGLRGLGNGLCLPAGPLREAPQRLRQVDFIVINGTMGGGKCFGAVHPLPPLYEMAMNPGLPLSLQTNTAVPWAALPSPVSAVAGIGHPERFFALLGQLGVAYHPHAFPDHHVFVAEDLAGLKKPIVMTEKDAVKCHALATALYCIPVEAKLGEEFWKKLGAALRAVAV